MGGIQDIKDIKGIPFNTNPQEYFNADKLIPSPEASGSTKFA